MQWTRDQSNRLIKVSPDSHLNYTLANLEHSELDNNLRHLETILSITLFDEEPVDVFLQLGGPSAEVITGATHVVVIPIVPFTITSESIFDNSIDDMSEQKVPLYSGEVVDKQEEFVDALWSYFRYKTFNERNGFVSGIPSSMQGNSPRVLHMMSGINFV